jgi:1-acyl-sn-glycerol-3-phosphate acyltransferase
MKKIIVIGKEKIPEKGPLLFIGNHQNALIDAILIPTTTRRNIHFLARASAFKNKIANAILRTLNMIPVYRIRDGVNTIEKNKAIFEQCYEYLNQNKAIEIFAEGEHHLSRKIIPLKKGFARIIRGTLLKYPDLEIKIVPVGLNFDTHLNFPSSVSVIYGEPIIANNYIDINNEPPSFKRLLSVVDDALKKLTLHIGDEYDYENTVAKLNAHNVDYLNPDKAKGLLSNLDQLDFNPVPLKKGINWFAPFQLMAKLNSILPLLIWKYLKGKIKEVLFTNTYRFGLIATLFPLFYLLQAFVIKQFFGSTYAFAYLLLCILLGIITTKTTPVDPV